MEGGFLLTMDYNISINQPKSIEWGLNLSEAAIFSWIYNVPSWSKKTLLEDGKLFFWASKGNCLEDMAIVTTKRNTLNTIYAKLESIGVIESIRRNNCDYVFITEKGIQWRQNKNTSVKKITESVKKITDIGEKNHGNYNTNTIYTNHSYLKDEEEFLFNAQIETLSEGLKPKPNTEGEKNRMVDEVRELFNKTHGKNFRLVSLKTHRQILKLFEAGYNKDDIIKASISLKSETWLAERGFSELNLEYITRPDKFEKYLQMSKIAAKKPVIETQTEMIKRRLAESHE